MKNILLALMLVAGTSAHAGFFDDVGDALDPSKNGTNEAFQDVGDGLDPAKNGTNDAFDECDWQSCNGELEGL